MRATGARLAVLAGALLAACARPLPPLPAPQPIADPAPSEVEHVYFLLGDAGDARRETWPILPRLQQDIEWWAAQLAADSAVTLLVLGDMLYPEGLHPQDAPEFARDSAILMNQVELVAGPAARKWDVRAYFLPGNHDWGLREDWEGFVRLARMDEFLRAASEALGARVELVPEPGTGGPFVLDRGRTRLLMLDTAWWLYMADGAAMDSTIARIDEALATAGERDVLIAAHHPFSSAGKHAGQIDFWDTYGVQYILSRSGAILQDLTSVPYRKLQSDLRATFARRGRPLVFIGGHDHSLQVLDGVESTDPLHNVVSGSASKLSDIGRAPGLRFGVSAPGYIRLVFEKDGGVGVFVEAVDPRYSSCPEEEPGRSECMAAGVAAYETVYSQRLR